jgi:hypothetical protein
MPIVGELVTSGMPEHVRVDRKWELSFARPMSPWLSPSVASMVHGTVCKTERAQGARKRAAGARRIAQRACAANITWGAFARPAAVPATGGASPSRRPPIAHADASRATARPTSAEGPATHAARPTEHDLDPSRDPILPGRPPRHRFPAETGAEAHPNRAPRAPHCTTGMN